MWHENWIGNRLEAEWLRITIYSTFLRGTKRGSDSNQWAISLVKDEKGVKLVEDNKLEGLDRLNRFSGEKERLALLKDFMAHSWLSGQKVYHSNKAKKQKATEHWAYIITLLIFGTTFVVSLLHLIPHSTYHIWNISPVPNAKVLTLLAIGLPTLGAALAGLESHFEFNKIARRSTIMVKHLKVLEGKLADITTISELSDLVDETENLMLQENSDWFFMIGTHVLKP